MTHLVIVFDSESDSPAVREELWQAFYFLLLFKYWGKEEVIKIHRGRRGRWRKSKTWRSPSSPQIHQKYIYTWNNSYRTPTECWQNTSDLPKGKKLSTYLGRAKEKQTKE